MTYILCPKCGKKGLRDVSYRYDTITRSIMGLRMGDLECKYCDHRVKIILDEKIKKETK